MFILLVGNIIDGYTVIGPFEDPEAASDYAEKMYRNDDWLVAALHDPIGK